MESVTGNVKDTFLLRMVHNISQKFNVASMVIMFLMIMFVAIDVIGRFFFNTPLKGSTDLVELMMGLVVFLGMGYCAMEDGHTRVDILYTRFSDRLQAIFDAVTLFASLFIYVLITWQLGKRALSYIADPTSSPSTDLLHIPYAYFIAIAAIGSAVLCLELLIQIIRNFYKVMSIPKNGTPKAS